MAQGRAKKATLGRPGDRPQSLGTFASTGTLLQRVTEACEAPVRRVSIPTAKVFPRVCDDQQSADEPSTVAWEQVAPLISQRAAYPMECAVMRIRSIEHPVRSISLLGSPRFLSTILASRFARVW
jgi:hypothetical protein